MLNKMQCIGRLGKDPESKQANSQTVCNFSVAMSESWKDKNTGEKKESTEWVNIVVWGSLADICTKYLHKGDLIYIEGKLKTRSWEKDGVTRYVTEIVAHEMKMLQTKGAAESKPAQNTNSGFTSAPGTVDDQDLPF